MSACVIIPTFDVSLLGEIKIYIDVCALKMFSLVVNSKQGAGLGVNE